MDAKELAEKITQIFIPEDDYEGAVTEVESLISSALSAQAAEVARLRDGVKLGMIYTDIVRAAASDEETQSEAGRDYTQLSSLIPPTAPEPTP